MTGQDFIPREVTGRVPFITISGKERLHIEQHRGLNVFHAKRVSFRTAAGELTVTGSELRFVSYSAQEATLCGRIESLTWTASGGRE